MASNAVRKSKDEQALSMGEAVLRRRELKELTDSQVVQAFLDGEQLKKFSTWIYTIASNLAKNELRNRSRNPLVLFQTLKQNWDADHRPLEWEDSQYKPDDLYRKRFLREKVEEAVAQLPEHHRVVFVLRELQGKTYEEDGEEPTEPRPQQLRADHRPHGGLTWSR